MDVQPSELATSRLTVYRPAASKVCMGLAVAAVFAAPLAGSPKSQAQAVME